MSKIDAPRIVQVLQQITVEDPDHVDDRAQGRRGGPRYVVHGQPHCLVAVVLDRLGVSTGAIAQLDRQRRPGEGSIQFSKGRHPITRRFTPGALALLDRVQELQDAGLAWGEVYQRVTTRYSARNDPWLQ